MRIALVNVNGGCDYQILSGRSNAGLTALEDALTQLGYEVKLFPQRNVYGNVGHALERIARDVIDYCPSAVGISCKSNFYSYLMLVASDIKRRALIPIIAGGLHFHFDYYDLDKKIINSVMDALLYSITVDGEKRRTIIDGVVVGHSKPFIDYVRNLDKEKGRLPEGLYTLQNNRFIGNGKGGFPKISRAPYAIETMKNDNLFWKQGKRKRLVVMGNSTCPQKCQYCCIENPNVEITPEMILSSIPPNIRDFSHISLADSNPFFYPNYYEEVFSAIRESGIRQPISTFLDPSRLILEDRDKIFEMIRRHGLLGLFLGRETTSVESAKAMGRNYFGKARSQKMLDEERVQILELIKYLGTIKNDLGFVVSVAYIFSPFDSLDTIIDNINELIEFKQNASASVRVTTVLSVLKPWPGTEIREKYIDLVFRPNDYLCGSAYEWDPKKFPKHTRFFSELERFISTTPKPLSIDSLRELKKKARRVFR